MGRLGLIGGHAILGDEPAGETLEVAVGNASVGLIDRGSHLMLQRHGLDRYRTAAAIDHSSNLHALKRSGCDRILAICSVGGLREDLGVGSFICPDDFVALHLGLSLSDDRGGERVPAIDPTWRERVMDAWRRVAAPELIDGGVYWQAIGPRFETAAEIRMIAPHADVIGMTMAAECILAGELGISYAAVCVVDNLANGIGGAPLAREDFEAGKATNRRRVLAALDAVVPALAGGQA